MMKKTTALSRALKIAVLMSGCALLFLLPIGGLSAAAEGYWSTQMNDEGQLVRIYTYTDLEPVTYLPVDPEETMASPKASVNAPSETHQAAVDVALAAAPKTAEQAEALPAKASSDAMGGLIAMGVLTLAGLAAALYKII
mgnify:CR=1 FL=1